MKEYREHKLDFVGWLKKHKPELAKELKQQYEHYILYDGIDEESAKSSRIDFDIFWDAYEKKVGKDKCKKKWAKMTAADQAGALSLIEEYKKVQPDKYYRKDPITYLNQKPWNDEEFIESRKKRDRQTARSRGADNFSAWDELLSR